MTKIRLISLACLASLALACQRQETSGSARGPSPASAQSEDTRQSQAAAEPASAAPPAETAAASEELVPASGTLTPSQNALGVPAAPPGAGTGPAGSTAAAESSEAPARTPDVVYVPTPQVVVDRMLKLAQVKKSDLVYDLGCGDGRIVVTAAKRYGARAVGFDIDPQRVAEARANVKAANVENLVTIEQKDIFTLDLSPASVVTLYLLPKLNVRLIPQLEKLKPGSRVVSHDFDMEGVRPLQHLTMHAAEDGAEHQIYFWKTPLVRE